MIQGPAAVLASSLFAVATALAQPPSGGIRGTIVDEQGGFLPGARVAVSGSVSRAAYSTADGRYEFADLPPGPYTVTVQLPHFRPQEQLAQVVPGEAAEVSWTLVLAALRGEELTVTASRQEVEVVNAPATVSVISSESIQTSPARNYGDLLRMVPGMNVIQMSARDINVTARQATNTLSNSQLALLDGRSIYLDFFGLILWDFVPTDPAEVKQIEIVRGPASAVWGANAMTGVVNIVTWSPRENPGGSINLSGGLFDRECDRCSQQDLGKTFGTGVRYAASPGETWSWKVSAGYFGSDAYSRPTGRIPVTTDPRDPQRTVGGASYPLDGPSTSSAEFGSRFQNAGTRQPKFDLRVDQEVAHGGRMSYQAGYGGTEGIIHTGLGPFDLQPGSYLAYGRVAFAKGAFKLATFANLLDADAPNLLAFDPVTRGPIQLNFSTQTFDLEAGNATALGHHHILTYGASVRRNNFSITLAPGAQDRTELGAYGQYEYTSDRARISLGARVDKFGNLEDPFFSPRVSVILKPSRAHSIRLSFNRAFRSPSAINNWLDQSVVTPIDLSPLAPLLPPPLRPAVAAPFPLVISAVGSEVPINGVPQDGLLAESLNAYEGGYSGTLGGKTTLTAAFYVNDQDNSINFTGVPPSRDPYTAQNPPPGWTARGLPPSLLTSLANLPPQLGGPIYLPRTASTYLNLGPLRNKGLELGIDHAFDRVWSAYANYSYQADPEPKAVGAGTKTYPSNELALPPTHRANAGVAWNGRRSFGSVSVSHAAGAFWSDVLDNAFAGFTNGYTMVNASLGVKWLDGRLTTAVKGINLLDQDVQQHLFGDILKRSLALDVRYAFARPRR